MPINARREAGSSNTRDRGFDSKIAFHKHTEGV